MRVVVGRFLAVFFLVSFAPSLLADTFTVTQGGCAGPGSLRHAVEQANANPGKDVIEFAPSVKTISPTSDAFGNCPNPESIRITDSVDITETAKPGVTISDNVQWITVSGHVNAGLACDAHVLLTADGTVPFKIEGDSNTEVTISGLRFEKNFGVLDSNNLATVNLQNVLISRNYQSDRKGCHQPLVSVVGQLNMTDVNVYGNTLDPVAPGDAIVWVRGGARLENVRFNANTAGSMFYQTGDADTFPFSIIRESSFIGPQPRVVLAGVRGYVVNSLIASGSSRAAGLHAFNSYLELINTTIQLPGAVSQIQAPSGELAAAMHVLAEGSGRVLLANTIVDGPVRTSQAYLPMVAATGTAVLEAASDSHITDGSGPQGAPWPPSSGSANLNRGFLPLGPPSKDGGRNDLAIDPETKGPLALDIDGRPRIQGPAVDKGAWEVQENHAYNDDYEVLFETFFDSTTSLTSSQPSVLDNDAWVNKDTPESPDVRVKLNRPPFRGTLDLKPDGTFTYDPPPGDYGAVTFTYLMLSDQPQISDEAEVTLNIRKEPFTLIGVHPDQYTINEGQQLVTNPTNAPIVNDQIDEFLYWAPLGSVVRVVDPPDHAASFDFPVDSQFSYTPEPGFVGTDSFTYEIYLEKTKKIVSVATTVTIEVVNVNDPPVALDDAYSMQQGVSKVFTRSLLGNDSDPDGNPLTVVKKSDPAHSTLTISGGFFSLMNLDPDFSGTDSFTYAASDGKLESNIAKVTIIVNAANKPPLAQPDKYHFPAETRSHVPARGGVLSNDSDPDGDGLSVSLAAPPAHGTLTLPLQPSGAFTYEPEQGFTGTDTFEYWLSDGKDAVSGIVTMIVTPANQPPLAMAESYTVVQDTTLTVPAPNLLANDSDPENHQLYLNIGQLPTHGQYTFNPAGDFIYTPDPGYVGQDIIGYTVSDGQLESQAVAVVITVTAAPVNEPPVAHNDAWSVQQDGFLDVASPGVLVNDTDPEGHGLTVDFVTSPAVGIFTTGVNGAFSYRPPAGYSGQVSFTYTVNDGHSDSAAATTLITVTEKNHAPVAHNDTYWMNTGLTLDVSAPGLLDNDTEPDGDILTVILSGPPSHGLLSNDGKGGFQYSPEFGFTGVDSFTYKLSDGALESNDATVQITVNGFNRAPVAEDDAYAVPQDTVLNVSAPGVLVNDGDPEGHSLTVTVTGQPAHGHLSPNPDGSFSYSPDSGYFGADSFTYTVNDGVIDSLEATVRLTIDETNLPPVANDDSYSAVLGAVLSVAAPGVIANDSDPEGHQLTAILLTQPSNGHLVPTSGGGFDYNADAGFTGQDSFTYRVSDGQLDSNVATVTITVDAATSITSVFTTSIDFTDNFPGAVTATLTCNAGLPLSQSFDISEGSPVNFTVTNLPFTTSGTRCEVTVPGLGASYTLNPSSCVFTYGGFANDGANSCSFVASAAAASYTVSKNWVLGDMAPEQLDDVDVTITCSSEILSVDGVDYAGGSSVVVSIGDSESAVVMVDTANGASGCSATEQATQNGVEVEYSKDCTDAALPAGGSAECTITNTLFFQGIPVFDRYGAALLALLLLGAGLAGMRRFI